MIPVDLEKWLNKLVYEAKRDYARAYATAILEGGDFPEAPDTKWARKAERRVNQILRPFVD